MVSGEMLSPGRFLPPQHEANLQPEVAAFLSCDRCPGLLPGGSRGSQPSPLSPPPASGSSEARGDLRGPCPRPRCSQRISHGVYLCGAGMDHHEGRVPFGGR